MNTITTYILTLVMLASCNTGVKTDPSIVDSRSTAAIVKNKKFKRIVVFYDSAHTSNYKLTLITFDSVNQYETKFNSIFIVAKKVYGGYLEIFKDSIYSSAQEVKFDDYNNDGAKDILVQNISDVRSNRTYYLYLINTDNDEIKKIRGFEEIKNPRFIAKYNLIDNYVNSGRNWTEFHRIKGDSIFSLGITIYDGEDDNGNVTYDDEYEKAIKKILK